MCHQTVCLIARYLEERGIATLVMGTALDIVKFGWPPRAAFMDAPLGHGGGPAFDPDRQLAIAREALGLFDRLREPGRIVTLSQTWPEGEGWKSAAADDSADDQRSPRDTVPRFQHEEDRVLYERQAAAAGG